MKKILLPTVMLGALTALNPAHAAGFFSYNYAEGGYTSVSDDKSDADGTGLYLKGSYDFMENLSVIASYASTDYDDTDVTRSGFSIGLGYHMPLAAQTDVLLSALLDNVTVEAGPGEEDDTGYTLGLGIRHGIDQNFEINGGLEYSSLFDDSSTAFNIGGRYHFDKSWSAGLNYTMMEDANAWTVSVRASF